MSLQEYQQALAAKIYQIQDVHALESIELKIDSVINPAEVDVTDILDEEEIEELRRMAENIDEKDYITYDEFRKNMEQWRTGS